MERLFNNVLQGNLDSPQDTFNECLKFNSIADSPILRAVNIFCWETINKTMLDLKDNLPYIDNGQVLCVGMITKTNNISETDFDLGIECMKSMSDMIIDKNDNLSKEEKKYRKRWIKDFLDIWKEYIKKEIEKK